MSNFDRFFQLSVRFAAVMLVALATGCGGPPTDFAEDSATASSQAALSVTPNAVFKPQMPVALGKAGTFAILTESGVTNVFPSSIRGDVGASPITGAAIGVTCDEVKTGRIFSVDAAGPLPCRVTNASLLATAVGDMRSAYTLAAGRLSPNFSELGAGEIGGLILVPGLYKWSSGVSITSDVTLAGNSKSVWVFQVAGTLTQASAKRVILTGGARASNVFWQVAGAVTIGSSAHFQGILLAKTNIAVQTGASVTGRLLAQTAVTLQQNTVTGP